MLRLSKIFFRFWLGALLAGAVAMLIAALFTFPFDFQYFSLRLATNFKQQHIMRLLVNDEARRRHSLSREPHAARCRLGYRYICLLSASI